MKFLRSACLITVLSSITLFACQTSAMTLEPMVYRLTPGAGGSRLVRVTNTLAAPLTVETSAQRRDLSLTGEQNYSPADDDFLIFPPQSVIQPGQSQAFRVQYSGSALEAARTYAVVFSQVPVNLETGEASGVQVAFRMETLAIVAPDGAKSNMRVDSVERGTQPNTLKITIENSGDDIVRVTEGTWSLNNGSGKVVQVGGKALQEAVGASWVPARGRRIITLPVPDDFFSGSGQLTALYSGA